MKRRKFFKLISSILAALGTVERLPLLKRYQQAFAEPNARKLALLVGINEYPQFSSLAGCLTDVELQKELLIYRFGFQPSDIITLTDQQATREGIESAFLEHLVKQAKASDAVFFHFSGYGTLVPQTLKKALIPVDGYISKQDTKIANYFLAQTLQLLLQNIPTDRVVAVLDTSYGMGSNLLLNGLQARSQKALEQAILTEGELELQKQLLLKSVNSLPTFILEATSSLEQFAREIVFSGFSAGLFTYALTQYLWSSIPAPTIHISLARVENTIQQLVGKQQPALFNGNKSYQQTIFNDYFPVTAEGVITSVDESDKIVQLHLAGIPPQVLEYYAPNSRFSILSQTPNSSLPIPNSLTLRSRSGLKAKAQIKSSEDGLFPEVGQFVQEAVRVLPRNINLTIGLDSKLERIEKVDATSAFAAIPRVTSVVAGEQNADYLLGKLQKEQVNSASSAYGLFTLGGELIHNTSGAEGEAVKIAVQRLAPKLPTLLATKLWRLTENEFSSRLNVKAALEIIEGQSFRVAMVHETTRKILPTNSPSFSTPQLPIGTKIQYRVQNNNLTPLYLMLIGLDGAKNAYALLPWELQSEADSTQSISKLVDVVIPPGAAIVVPQTTLGLEWTLQAPAFWCETQLIFSTVPFSKTLTALEEAKYPIAHRHRVAPLLNPVEVAQAILQDLHNASMVAEFTNPSTDVYALDVNKWASLSFIYQVV